MMLKTRSLLLEHRNSETVYSNQDFTTHTHTHKLLFERTWEQYYANANTYNNKMYATNEGNIHSRPAKCSISNELYHCKCMVHLAIHIYTPKWL